MAAPPLSPEQRAACDLIEDWLDDRRGPQVFQVRGPAGTGKTTIAVLFANLRGSIALAFQGKAVSALRRKGAIRVSRCHSFLYERPETVLVGDGRAKLDWHLREYIEPRDLLVIDEASTIDADLGRDLMRQDARILTFGDDFQLPPIDGKKSFFSRSPFDIHLRRIHRQALDSPVLRMATRIRQGMPLPKGRQYDLDALLEADIVISAMHHTRRAHNLDVRCIKYGIRKPIDTPPIVGEKIISLRTNHVVKVYNGTIWRVERVKELPDEILLLDLFDKAEGYEQVRAPRAVFNAESYPDFRDIPQNVTPFDFAYAITCHKAQGSEWENVAVLDEMHKPGFRKMAGEMPLPDFQRRWLYTAVTRARERVEIYKFS